MDNDSAVRPTWRSWVGLVLLSLPMFMMATDLTALFLAVPSIAADLQPSATELLWIMHVGEFVAAGLVITMGRLADKIGQLKLLLISMALYGVSSALAAFSTSPEMLILSRMFIGAAVAAASPAAVGLLRSMFVSAKHYGIAFAILMGAFTVGGTVGPPMGGLLLEFFWWGSVFLVNVPIAALTLIAGAWLLPNQAGANPGRIDSLSVGLSMGSVILVVFGMQEIADQGMSVWYAASIVMGSVLAWLFVRRQRKVSNPLLDLELFKYRTLKVAVSILIIVSLAFMASDLVLVQYLQVVLETPMATLGLLLAIPGVASIVATALTPIATRVMTPSHVMSGGIVVGILGAAAIIVAIGLSEGTLAWAIVGTSLIAFGVSPVMILGAQLVVTTAPKDRTGSAVAIQDIGSGMGAAIGMAAFGSVAMMIFSRTLTSHAPDSVAQSELQAASQSPGEAVVVSEAVGGTDGAQLREAINHAWSLSTQVVFGVAVVLSIGLIVLVLKGLRGVRLPSDEPNTPDGDWDPNVKKVEFSSDETGGRPVIRDGMVAVSKEPTDEFAEIGPSS